MLTHHASTCVLCIAQGVTPLIEACKAQEEEAIELLLASGADVNAADNQVSDNWSTQCSVPASILCDSGLKHDQLVGV